MQPPNHYIGAVYSAHWPKIHAVFKMVRTWRFSPNKDYFNKNKKISSNLNFGAE